MTTGTDETVEKNNKNPTARTGETCIPERAGQGERTLDPKGYPLEVQKRGSMAV